MQRKNRWGRALVLAICALLVCIVVVQDVAWATDAADTGSGFYLETLGAKIFRMMKNVVVPLLLIGIVVFAGGNIAFGWVQMGPGLSRMLLGAAIICGGVETILLLVGSGSDVAALLL